MLVALPREVLEQELLSPSIKNKKLHFKGEFHTRGNLEREQGLVARGVDLESGVLGSISGSTTDL